MNKKIIIFSFFLLVGFQSQAMLHQVSRRIVGNTKITKRFLSYRNNRRNENEILYAGVTVAVLMTYFYEGKPVKKLRHLEEIEAENKKLKDNLDEMLKK